MAIFISTVFNLVLSSFGVSYLYLLFTILGIVLILIRGVVIRKNDIYFVLFFIFFLISTISHIISNLALTPTFLLGAGMYIISPIYWILLYRCKSKFELSPIFYRSTKWVLIIALFGLIQFYFSPDLFGIIKTSSNNIVWATEDSEKSYMDFFRATSFLGSPQVYGLFLILFLFPLYDLYSNRKVFRFLLLSFIVIAAIHSGNKISFVILFIFLLYVLKENFSLKNFLYILALFLTLLISSLVIVQKIDFRIINRISSIDQILGEEKEGRLSIYKNQLMAAQFPFGNGPGYNSIKIDGGEETKVAESYLLQILIENGIFIFLMFLSFLISLVFLKMKKGFKEFNGIKYSLIAIVFSMLVVHSFNNPAFFIFWGVIFYVSEHSKRIVTLN